MLCFDTVLQPLILRDLLEAVDYYLVMMRSYREHAFGLVLATVRLGIYWVEDVVLYTKSISNGTWLVKNKF